MNNQERLYLLEKCKKHYDKAIKLVLKEDYSYLEELGKARAIKEIIEEYIDCQNKKYYIKYIEIVNYEKILN